MIVHDVEQGTQEWLDLRLGIPTASNGSNLVTSRGDPSKSMMGYAHKLAGDKFAGEELNKWMGNQFTERGHEVEPAGRLSYEMLGYEVEQVGFITDDVGMCGCSPDSLVGDDGMLEIKCLPKKHIDFIDYYSRHKKAPSDYIVQCQFQLLVTGREWCDLYYYHGKLPCQVVRQHRNDKILTELTTQILLCFEERNRMLDIMENWDG